MIVIDLLCLFFFFFKFKLILLSSLVFQSRFLLIFNLKPLPAQLSISDIA